MRFAERREIIMSARFRPLREERQPGERYGRLMGYAVLVNRVTVGYLQIHPNGHDSGYIPDAKLGAKLAKYLRYRYWPLDRWQAVMAELSRTTMLHIY